MGKAYLVVYPSILLDEDIRECRYLADSRGIYLIIPSSQALMRSIKYPYMLVYSKEPLYIWRVEGVSASMSIYSPSQKAYISILKLWAYYEGS